MEELKPTRYMIYRNKLRRARIWVHVKIALWLFDCVGLRVVGFDPETRTTTMTYEQRSK